CVGVAAMDLEARVQGPRAQVEDSGRVGIGTGGEQLRHGLTTPTHVDAHAHEAVGAVVARGDVGEHRLHLCAVRVEGSDAFLRARIGETLAGALQFARIVDAAHPSLCATKWASSPSASRAGLGVSAARWARALRAWAWA